MIEQLLGSRLLNWLLLIAIIGDFAVPYFLAAFYKGYRHKLMVMSSLGNPSSPVRIFYQIWLVTLGILLLLASAVLVTRYWPLSKPLTLVAVILLSIFAVGAGILSGIFIVNESKKTVTLSSKIHGAGAALGFIALLFVPLLLAILSFGKNDKLAGILFSVAFVLSVLFFVLFIMADKPQFSNTIIKYEGLWQRLSLLFMYVPLGYIAIENLVSLPK